MLNRRHLLMLALAAGPLAAAPALAQAPFPSKQIRLIVPYPAGGPADVLSRLVAQSASETLGQQLVVDNRPGGNAAIGTDLLAKAEPDGHTIGLGSNQTHATNQSLVPNLPHDPVRDMVPVSGGVAIQHALVVRPDLEAKSAQELVAMAKAKPGVLNYGSSGNGSASHLAAELFKTRTGTDIVHVPFKGAPPMVAELIAGRLDLSFATVPSVIGQIRAGQLRAIAVASPNRSDQLPDVPTLAEAGFPGAEADAWFAFFAPAKTPPAAIQALHAAIDKALREPANQEKLVAIGFVPRPAPPEEVAAFLAPEAKKWAEVVKISGATID